MTATSRLHGTLCGLGLAAGVASAAQAWDFTPGLPCLLTHETDQARIELTYDPTQPLYSVTIRRDTPFAWSDVFAIRFHGSGALTITTNQHALSRDGRAVTVVDTGFGNVLNGLQFNQRLTALLGDQSVEIPLDGAADPVEAFRHCRGRPTV